MGDIDTIQKRLIVTTEAGTRLVFLFEHDPGQLVVPDVDDITEGVTIQYETVDDAERYDFNRPTFGELLDRVDALHKAMED